jgi:hypothetical protein
MIISERGHPDMAVVPDMIANVKTEDLNDSQSAWLNKRK